MKCLLKLQILPLLLVVSAQTQVTNTLDKTASQIGGIVSGVTVPNKDFFDSKIFSRLVEFTTAFLERGYSANDFASLAAAINRAATDTATVIVSTNESLATSDTLPATAAMHVLKGGRIDVASGQRFYIEGKFTAGRYQVFNDDDSVLFANGSINEVYPEWFGAVAGDDVDDRQAIRKAISSVKPFAHSSITAHVVLGSGTYNTTGTIEVPHQVVLRGQGPRNSFIKTLSAFPAATHVIFLGEEANLYADNNAFYSRLDDVTIDCSRRSGSIGVKSTRINEFAGIKNVHILDVDSIGIYIDANGGAPSGGAQNWFLEDIDIIFHGLATNNTGILIDGESSNFRGIDNVTIAARSDSCSASGGKCNNNSIAMRLTRTPGGFVSRIHVENVVEGIVIGGDTTETTSGLHVSGVSGNSDVVNLVRIASGTSASKSQHIVLSGLSKANGTNVLADSANSIFLTASHVGFYAIGGGTSLINRPTLTTDVNVTNVFQGIKSIPTVSDKSAGHFQHNDSTFTSATFVVQESRNAVSQDSDLLQIKRSSAGGNASYLRIAPGGRIFTFPDAAGTPAFGTRVNGVGSDDNFQIRANGSLNWLDGTSSTPDIVLSRSAANHLDLATGDTLLAPTLKTKLLNIRDTTGVVLDTNGAATVSATNFVIDTFGAAALDTVVTLTGRVGDIIYIRSRNSSRDITFLDSGNFSLSAERLLDNVNDVLALLAITPTTWKELFFSDNN